MIKAEVTLGLNTVDTWEGSHAKKRRYKPESSTVWRGHPGRWGAELTPPMGVPCVRPVSSGWAQKAPPPGSLPGLLLSRVV